MCWIYKLLQVYWSDCGGQRRGLLSNVRYQSLQEGCGKLRVWECGLAVVNKHLIGWLVVLMTGTVIHSGPQRAVSNCLAARVDLLPPSRVPPSQFPGLQGFTLIRLTQTTKTKSKCHTNSEQRPGSTLHHRRCPHLLYFSIKKALLCLDLMKNKTEKKYLKKVKKTNNVKVCGPPSTRKGVN